MRRFILIPVIAILLSSVSSANDWTREENVVYRVLHGTGLVMDIFRPTGTSNGLAIVDVLSGAWYSEQAQVNDHMNGGTFDVMCSHGYTVFMVRPGSRTKWTAEEMVGNLHYAIRFIKHNAETYGIDPNHIGIMGASAGGHLSLLTAFTPTAGNPEVRDPVMHHDASVHCVAVFFPPTDLIEWEEGGQSTNFERIGNILFPNGIDGRSAEEVQQKAVELSPARMTIQQGPPTLLIHGDKDDVVPLFQSTKMVEVLESAQVPVELYVKEGGGHAWLTIRQEVEMMAKWFNTHLLGQQARAR